MGLLQDGHTLTWEETVQAAPQLKNAAATQLIKCYNRFKHLATPHLTWGYELEYYLVQLNANQSIEPFVTDESFLEDLNDRIGIWHPEYCSFVVESVPDRPFSDDEPDLAGSLLKSMLDRGFLLTDVLSRLSGGGRQLQWLLMGSFPTLGVEPVAEGSRCENSKSAWIPFKYIADHIRFPTLTRNIVKRRGDLPVSIRVPVFQDRNTRESVVEMDAMAFGMGCCCLQVTFQACDLDEACFLYDQLLAFAPIALAMSASSPCHRGFLTDVDCRWDVISDSVDDRTASERATVCKSRYSSASRYLSKQFCHLNDLYIPHNDTVFKRLRSECDMPASLAEHFALLFIRDPLVAYASASYGDARLEPGSVDLFDNINSSNWNSVRLKVPVADGAIGWRVEFRSMDVQFGHKENAAFSLLILGFVRLLRRHRCLYPDKSYTCIPITLVDQNMQRAQRRNGLNDQKFHWINEKELSIAEIMCDEREGLLSKMEIEDCEFWSKFPEQLAFLKDRSLGTRETDAAWLRRKIREHADYRFDSVVTPEMMHSIALEIKKTFV